MDFQVYALAHIAVNLEFHIFILLNSFFPQFLSYCIVWMCECVCSCVRLVYVLGLYK